MFERVLNTPYSFYESAIFFKQTNCSGIWLYYEGFKDPDRNNKKKVWLAQFTFSLFTSAVTEVRVQVSEL